MHRVAIDTVDGDDLGAMEFGRPEWPVGSTIYRGGDEPNLRVVEHRERDGATVT